MTGVSYNLAAFGCALVVALCATQASAASFLANIYQNNMVLQAAPKPATLHGWATVGDTVSVTMDGSLAATATADSTGLWIVHLAPVQASFDLHQITITSSSGATASLKNVLFGDVFICAGQSNMLLELMKDVNATVEMARAISYNYLRLVKTGHKLSVTPLEELPVAAVWAIPDNTTATTRFSAVCIMMAEHLFDKYQIPIGLIESAESGTIIELWTPAAYQCACGTGTQSPSRYYNGELHPYSKMTVKAAIWYQGESNVDNYQCYGNCSMPNEIAAFRNVWGNNRPADLPFIFIQLAAYNLASDTLPLQRLEQAKALSIPNTGMATAVDLGMPDGGIHPTNKHELARRVALVVRRVVYQDCAVISEGPVVSGAHVVSTGSNVVVHLSFRKRGSGLVLRTPQCPVALNSTDCGHTFEVQIGGNWVPAQYALGSDSRFSVVLTAPSDGTAVTRVRHLFAQWPLCALYNKEGLPAFPFDIQLPQ